MALAGTYMPQHCAVHHVQRETPQCFELVEQSRGSALQVYGFFRDPSFLLNCDSQYTPRSAADQQAFLTAKLWTHKQTCPYALPCVLSQQQLSVLVDAENAHFVQRRQFGDKQDQGHAKVQEQRLAFEVCAVQSQNEQHDRHACEELSRARVLHAVVKLLPEGQLVVLALVCVDGGSLQISTQNNCLIFEPVLGSWHHGW